MSYVDNAPLISAWNTRVQALKDSIETLYDGTSHNVLIEGTGSNVLLASLSLDGVESPSGVLTLENPELASNGQEPQVVIEQPTLTLEPEEGSDDQSDQEEEKEDTVEETVEETVDETDEEPSEETEEVVSEE